MTLLGDSPKQRLADDLLARPPRSADATTILAIFVALQFVLPSALIFNGIPLSLSAATLVALGLGALWLGTQLTTTLGAAKGRNPVRTALFVYSCVLLASYAASSANYLPPDERKIGDHMMVTVFALDLRGDGGVRRCAQSWAAVLPAAGAGGLRLRSRRGRYPSVPLQLRPDPASSTAGDAHEHRRPLGPDPRRPAAGGRHGCEPDRVRRLLRHDAADRSPHRVRRQADWTIGRHLVDLRGAHRHGSDVLGLAVRDRRHRVRVSGPPPGMVGPTAGLDGLSLDSGSWW